MSNPHYTHQKYLLSELDKINKELNSICLEFGIGDGSSSIFKKILEQNNNITIFSYENDINWYNITKEKYKHNNYHFNFIDSWDVLLNNNNFDKIYDVVFVDQSPWDARIKTIEQLKNNTKVFILHDYDYFNNDSPIIDKKSVDDNSFFSIFHNDFILEPYFEFSPPTLILRNKKYIFT